MVSLHSIFAVVLTFACTMAHSSADEPTGRQIVLHVRIVEFDTDDVELRFDKLLKIPNAKQIELRAYIAAVDTKAIDRLTDHIVETCAVKNNVIRSIVTASDQIATIHHGGSYPMEASTDRVGESVILHADFGARIDVQSEYVREGNFQLVVDACWSRINPDGDLDSNGVPVLSICKFGVSTEVRYGETLVIAIGDRISSEPTRGGMVAFVRPQELTTVDPIAC